MAIHQVRFSRNAPDGLKTPGGVAEGNAVVSMSEVLESEFPSTDIVSHGAWTEARHQLLTWVLGCRVLALVGEAGSGRSSLLRDVAATLSARGEDVWLADRVKPPRYGGRGIVLVDEADTLSQAELHAILRQGKHCILAGPPDIVDVIARDLTQPLVVVLGPVAEDEIGLLLVHHLLRAGHPPNLIASLLSPDKIALLARETACFPRQLIGVADLAVFLARLEDAQMVTEAHVEEAIERAEGTDLLDEDTIAEPESRPPAVATPSRARRRVHGTRMAVSGLILGCALVAGLVLGLGVDIKGLGLSGYNPWDFGHRLLDFENSLDARLSGFVSAMRRDWIVSREAGPSRGSRPVEAGPAVPEANARPAADAAVGPSQKSASTPSTANAPFGPVASPAPALSSSAIAQGVPPVSRTELPPPAPDRTAEVPDRAAQTAAAVGGPDATASGKAGGATDSRQQYGGILRPVVVYPKVSAWARAYGLQLTQDLRGMGYLAGEPEPGNGRPWMPSVTYFFAEDGPEASRLARSFGGSLGDARLAPIPSGTLPRPGAVLIMLPFEARLPVKVDGNAR